MESKMNSRSLIFLGLLIGFFLLGYNAFMDAKPEPKSERIYKELKSYMPYEIERRVGGYSIISKETGIKEKPPATEVFKRLDELEKMWGKEFLMIENNTILVKDKTGKTIGKVAIELESEKKWVQNFFQIQ